MLGVEEGGEGLIEAAWRRTQSVEKEGTRVGGIGGCWGFDGAGSCVVEGVPTVCVIVLRTIFAATQPLLSLAIASWHHNRSLNKENPRN